MTERIEFVLPTANGNTYWRRRGSTYLYQKPGSVIAGQCAYCSPAAAEIKPAGRLAIKIIAEPPDKRRRDLDNILKAPLDALTHAGLLMDDEQFDEINIVRGQPLSGGRLGVRFTP
ncbi:RusA family crossover junction endodeoxyribonuclease (plasmid) [Escherichia coli]|nr:RusA family crossover junction endodeoxyribonuclease [Escherichia coli]